MSIKNILEMYERSDSLDHEQGLTWYAEAFRLCGIFSREYGQSVEVVVAVMAALSPRNKWSQNVKDVVSILAAVNAGHPADTVKVGTTNTFRDRAYEIAATGKIGLLRGSKVWTFWKNIIDHDHTDLVTVDVWAYRVAVGNLKAAPKINDTVYNDIERQYQEAARKVGLRPLELQAITWVAARRYAKVQGGLKQLALF